MGTHNPKAPAAIIAVTATIALYIWVMGELITRFAWWLDAGATDVRRYLGIP